MKTENRVTRTVLLFILFSNLLVAQNFGTITGSVKDEHNIPLIGASVRIEKTLLGSSTSKNGLFKIAKVPAGLVTVKVSMIGYETKIVSDVVVKPKETTTLNVTLKQTSIEKNTVVVTASRYEEKISEVPISVSLIDLKEINTRNIYQFEDALRYVPGVSVTLDQVSIRGSTGYSRGAGARVMMLFDGLPLFSGDTQEIIWGLIPPHEIERVEVVKGAGSALYGSSALGGIINLIPKETSENPIYYFKLFGGIYDNPYYDEWKWSNQTRFKNGFVLSHSRKISNLNFNLSLMRFEDDSYRKDDWTKRYNLFLKAKYDFTSFENLKILFNMTTYKSGLFVFWKDSRNALVPPEGDQGQSTEAFRFNTHASYQKVFSEELLFEVKSSWFHNDWKDNTESSNSAKSNVFRSEVQLNYFFQPKNKLTCGIAGDYSIINSNMFGNPYSFGTALFAQNEWKPFEELKATFGFRFDYQKVDTALSESQVSPKLGLNYQPYENLILRLSAGRGYRAPSAAEMFTSTRASGITVRPNPNLKSESSWSFEVGSNFSFSNWLSLDLALFQNEYYDLIEPGFDERGEVIFRNITRARIQGLESGLTFTPIENFWNLNIGYTYMWARDTKLNSFLKYRPRHLLYLANVLRYDFIELGIDFRYWNRIENIDDEFIKLGIIQDGELRDKVLVTDLRLSFDLIHFSLPMRAYFSVNNLFNYNYVELIGNLAPIRNFVLTIESIL